MAQHDGDLVAKIFYVKRKMVWEILEICLKSKIEIKWDDIIGMRVVLEKNQPGSLDIEVYIYFLFFSFVLFG